MTFEEAKNKLSEFGRKSGALNHALSLIFHDGETAAPRGTGDNRGRTIEILSEELYRMTTDPATVEMLETLDAERDRLTDEEARITELYLEDLNDMKKIPMEEYLESEKLLNEASDVWHSAKVNSDFATFAPYLEKIVETKRRFAGYLAPEKDPYDYWLDKYEEGINREVCDSFFGSLREKLVPLIADAGRAKLPESGIRNGYYPVDAQKKLSVLLMKTMGLNPDRVGIAETEHPYTTSIGSHLDVRITTHYYENDFLSSMYSVIHEGGHALYDSGSPDRFAFTPLDGGVSMGVHESQSRFYENIIGRSRSFCEYIFPELDKLFPGSVSGVDELYREVNRVTPSLIRTEADEVTYCLHVMVRYELEKRLMSGELKVKDLPGEWNRLYREYLGVEPSCDREGVLQDSHWSGGSIGYFPSYALGSAYGAQFLAKMKETIDVEACVARGDFAPINEWNREHIWKYGSLLKPGKLTKQVFGGDFDPSLYVKYLEEKVRDVYGLK
ncbi:MAG: carboxypeptidase M32 [Clostridia bacterium]|nr:carboxypeptidase M32 [Clostridia bacterium]